MKDEDLIDALLDLNLDHGPGGTLRVESELRRARDISAGRWPGSSGLGFGDPDWPHTTFYRGTRDGKSPAERWAADVARGEAEPPERRYDVWRTLEKFERGPVNEAAIRAEIQRLYAEIRRLKDILGEY